MSLSNGGSSSTVNSQQRYQGVGVEKRCACGARVVNLSSKSEANPRRRYLRCEYAAAQHLVNDGHVFKWLDVALLEECETITDRIERLEAALSIGLDYMKEMGDDMLLEAKLEVRRGLKMMGVIVLVGLVVFFALVKLV